MLRFVTETASGSHERLSTRRRRNEIGIRQSHSRSSTSRMRPLSPQESRAVSINVQCNEIRRIENKLTTIDLTVLLFKSFMTITDLVKSERSKKYKKMIKV